MPSVLPYYILYCRDLMSSGYDWWDLPRVHGLDLLLIPVNLTGLLKSLRQAITGHQSPFGRTPKVKGRVAAPATQILMPLAILSAIIGWSVTVMTEGGWTVGVFGLINGTCLGYALLLYIGVREGLEDIRASLRTRFEPLALGLRRLLGAPSDGPKRLPQVSREAESREAKSA